MIEIKHCNHCGKDKPITEFGKCRYYKDGLSVYCRDCHRIISHNDYLNHKQARLDKVHRTYRRLYKKTAQGRYYTLRARAGVRGKDFNLNRDDFVEWFEKQSEVCCYCGHKIEYSNNIKSVYSSTIDRIDNQRGYEIDNLAMACRRCNTIKGNWFTASQMREIASKYFKEDSNP